MPSIAMEAMDPTGAIATITQGIDRLRSLTQAPLQSHWHGSPGSEALTLEQVLTHGPTWPLAPLNHRHHISWPQGRQSLWLYQRLTVPTALDRYPLTGHDLALGLTWWADWAEIFVNGALVQTGDLFECFTRIPLGTQVQPGDSFDLALHLISPGHDSGALVQSQVVYTAPPDLGVEPGFVADELAVLQRYLETLESALLTTVAAAIAPLDWSTQGDQAAFLQELAALRHRLAPLSPWIKQREIRCLGHAHLDLAWLWPLEETWVAAQRTFQSVLSLQQQFPELTYTHSSPALFHWLETHEPDLFHQVQGAVQGGRWAIDAGLWVEPELNTVGGESLARQILYGQHYCRDRFGRDSAIAWLPDSFGFSWQLPQLLRQGNIRYFATQKLRWNDTTPFPYHLFWWQGLDGTRIPSVTLPPIGSDLDPVAMAHQGATWEQHTGLSTALWLPGLGDHGGGPTAAMMRQGRRWATSPFFPRLTYGHGEAFLDEALAACGAALPAPIPPEKGAGASPGSPPLAPSDRQGHPLPVWRDELYLELHRGCYTTHGDQKWYNRRCESHLFQAELWGAIATLLTPDYTYPQAALAAAWKAALFNQFHDILPGTAIPSVFTTANQSWQAALDTATEIHQGAIAALVPHLPLPPAPCPGARPLLVFNPLNWQRSELVALPLTALDGPGWQVLDWDGQPLPSQRSQEHPVPPPGCLGPGETITPVLCFQAQEIPPVGYRCYWLVPGQPSPTPAPPPQWQLQNEYLTATVDPDTGDLVSLWDHIAQRQAIAAAANQLQGYHDGGQYWDAWNLAPDYPHQPLPAATLQTIAWVESGPLRQRLRVVRQLGSSQFQQDYVLDQGCPYLRVETVVDWQETHVVAKVAFPLTVTADTATYDIPFGAIRRPIQSPDPHQGAKWEVPALGWADLSAEIGTEIGADLGSENSAENFAGNSAENRDRNRDQSAQGTAYGVSILTDYKHGFDVQPQQLRLTLLKAPLWPDPTADRGRHGFSYGIFPHQGTWVEGRTPQQAIAFRHPLQGVLGSPTGTGTPVPNQPIPDQVPDPDLRGRSFLSLGTEDVAIAALKRSEDGQGWILRCWDLYGQGSTLHPHTAWPASPWQRTNLLEDLLDQDLGGVEGSEDLSMNDLTLAPWAIATYRFTPPEQP